MNRILVGLLALFIIAGCEKERQAPASPNAVKAIPAKGSYQGMVSDSAGKPIDGASISIYVVENATRTGKKVAEAKTEAGAFQVSDGIPTPSQSQFLSFIASSPDYAWGGSTLTSNAPQAANAISITLEKPLEVEGRVMDKDQKPIRGAKVYPQAVKPAAAPGVNSLSTFPGAEDFSATTDAEGRFVFKQIPADYRLGAVITHPDYASLYMLADGPSPAFVAKDKESTFTLRAPGSISGMVVDEQTSKHVPNVKLIFSGVGMDPRGGFGWSGAATSDRDGNFKITNLPPMGYTISAAPDSNTGVVLQKMGIQVGEGEDKKDVKVTWTAGAMISGVLTDARTNGILPDARIWASKSAGTDVVWNGSASTDEQGRWSMRVPTGNVTVAASGKGGGTTRFSTEHEPLRRQELEITAGKDIADVKLQLYSRPTVKFTGTVLAPDDKPLKGVKIFPGNGWGARPSETDAEGKFTLETPVDKPQEYQGKDFSVLLSDTSDNLAGMISIETVEAGDRKETVKLIPAGSAKVHFSPEGADAITEGRAQLRAVLSSSQSKLTVPFGEIADIPVDGNVTFNGLDPRNSYILLSAAPGFGKGISQSFQVKAGETADVGTIVLKKATVFLTGTITDSNGAPANQAQVIIDGDAQPMGVSVYSEADGSYKIGPIVKGPAILTVNTSQSGKTTRQIEITSDTTETLDVSLASGGEGASNLRPGSKAPDVKGVDWLQGKDQLKAMQGKAVALVFLSASSKQSPTVLSMLSDLSNKLDKDKILIVVIFDTTSSKEEIQKALGKAKFTYPAGRVAEDSRQGWDSPVFKSWSIVSVPTINLVDGAGKIIKIDISSTSLERELKAAIGK